MRWVSLLAATDTGTDVAHPRHPTMLNLRPRLPSNSLRRCFTPCRRTCRHLRIKLSVTTVRLSSRAGTIRTVDRVAVLWLAPTHRLQAIQAGAVWLACGMVVAAAAVAAVAVRAPAGAEAPLLAAVAVAVRTLHRAVEVAAPTACEVTVGSRRCPDER